MSCFQRLPKSGSNKLQAPFNQLNGYLLDCYHIIEKRTTAELNYSRIAGMLAKIGLLHCTDYNHIFSVSESC